jgi:maltose-binding protein MalE
MEKQKALELIKHVIDQSVKGGLMPNVDTAVAIAEAFQTIVNELEKPALIEAKQD